MKYIKLFEQQQTEANIHEICKKYNIENYSINADMSVDVYGSVDIYNKGLTHLPLVFNHVSGYFNCARNCLTNLQGSPKKIDGGFNCSSNYLTNLIGIPTIINGLLDCGNNDLVSLRGGPIETNGNIDLSHNVLPEEIKHLSWRMLNLLFKYQVEYGIWNEDDSFNLSRFKIFQKDVDNEILG